MTDFPNTDQAEFWNGRSGLSWITNEQEQDHLLAAASKAVLAAACLSPGERILDIGCGTGSLSLEAAKSVGASGQVLATDISAPLLRRTSERAGSLPQITTHLADAETAEWPQSEFDAAISRFGVMFFANPTAAFANIARALKPGGRIVFAAWAPSAVNLWWHMPNRIASNHLGLPPKTSPHAPGPMGLSDIEWSLNHFRAAGLIEPRCEVTEITLQHDGGAEGAANLSLRVGPAARIISMFDADAAQIESIRSEIKSAVSKTEVNGTAQIPATIHLYSATVP
ncbi:MAG: methyltransferase domain-containing protein [Boseongicola sp.]|nr:MAG: methyltransferase domain-containing protein [Boseongicola sp.]